MWVAILERILSTNHRLPRANRERRELHETLSYGSRYREGLTIMPSGHRGYPGVRRVGVSADLPRRRRTSGPSYGFVELPLIRIRQALTQTNIAKLQNSVSSKLILDFDIIDFWGIRETGP